MTPQDPAQKAQAVRDQAIAWLVRVESDAADEGDWLGLEAWLAEAPEHREAFEALELMSAAFADQADLIAPGLASDQADGVADLVARRAGPVLSRRTWITAGVSAAAAVLAGVIGLSVMGQPTTTLYEAERGHPRTVRLDDGSTIGLNGGSTVRVRFERGARRVYMDNAEAAFDVARDPARPFIVEAGDRRVQVLGTEFNVRSTGETVTVTVRRGVVQVGAQEGDGPVARLTAGKELTHRRGSPASSIRDVAPDDAFAWKAGRLVCRDRRLGDIVADLNRQLPTPIIVEGRAADLRFSGVLIVEDEASVLQALQAYLPVKAARVNGAIRLESR